MDALDAHIIMETNYLPIGDRKIFSNAVKTANKIPKRRLDTPGYSYFGSRRYYRNDESGYKGHEYDLFEYSRIIDTEAIVARAFERKRALIFKNGYFFKSNNDANIKYIKQRLREIEYVSGVTFKSFIEELTNNLIMFHNAYVVLVRDKDKSNGKTVFIDGNEVEPIAGWFNLPTESMQRKIKPNGEISVENNKKPIKTGDFLEVLANNNYSVKSLDTLKLIEIGEKIGDETMENQTLKMLESASAFSLADCVDYKEGQIVSKNLVAKSNLVITVMSFWKGESLDPHKAPGDALVTVLDGEGKYIVDGKAFIVKKGESAVLPANIPHAVEAETQNFKMMLTLVK